MFTRTISIFFFLLLLLSFGTAQDRSKIVYNISFENAVHHEAEVSVTFVDIPSETLELRMSRSSPGRYALHEFGKNVYSIKAVDGNGSALTIDRPNPYQWNVSGHNGTVITVTYTLFADHADGTYSGIDETHAHLNMPATFMWAQGMENVPIEITFQPRTESNWRVATQLPKNSFDEIYFAPDLYYFLDSPTELSDYSIREWTVENGGGDAVIRLVVHHDGTETEIDALRDMIEPVMEEQKAVFGEYPEFDYGTYTFLACYLPYVSGDGMEHRNSTILTTIRPLRSGISDHLGTASHEFFHAWNVERIRPKTLEPFNFEEVNMSGELWFAEGFTSYYDDLTIKRAGLMSVEEYASSLASRYNDDNLNAVINGVGRQFHSPVEMSQQSPFVDAARSVDAVNRNNIFISYYTYGKVIALGLDLTLRTQFGLTLDDYMEAVWESQGKTEFPYTIADLESILGRVTGDRGFAASFFQHFVNGRDVIDYKRLLDRAGFLLRRAYPGQPVLGKAPLQFGNSGAVIGSYTAIGSPLYSAGLDKSDVILSIDGTRIVGKRSLDDILESQRPGDTIIIHYVTRAGVEKTTTLRLTAHDRYEVVLYEDASLPVTDAMQAFRKSWLDSKAK